MRNRRRTVWGAALALALASGVGLFAATVTVNEITLTYPGYPVTGPAFQTCDPASEPALNQIRLDGIPEGSSVFVVIYWARPFAPDILATITQTFTNVTGGTLIVPIQYPASISEWPIWNSSTNEHALAVAVNVRVQDSLGNVTKLVGKKWWMQCIPPKDFEGCTPGYWRQEHHFDSWVASGYTPTDDFESIFGVDASFDPTTLETAIWLGGGGENALARHAVAALLNAAHPDVNFALTVAQIIAGVQAAYASGDFEPLKTQLDFANNARCPLN